MVKCQLFVEISCTLPFPTVCQLWVFDRYVVYLTLISPTFFINTFINLIMYPSNHAISFIQLLSTDYTKIRRTVYTTHTYLYTGGFVMCLFLMYTNTSAFLQQAGDSPSSCLYTFTLTPRLFLSINLYDISSSTTTTTTTTIFHYPSRFLYLHYLHIHPKSSFFSIPNLLFFSTCSNIPFFW